MVIMVPEEGLDGVMYGIQFNRCLFVILKSGDWYRLLGNLLDICKANNLFIVNGRIGDDKTESGKITCKNSSVVDYCICTCSFLQF